MMSDRGTEAEVILLRSLLVALLDEHPKREIALARLKGMLDAFGAQAQTEEDQELAVEVLARYQVYLQLFEK